MEKQWQCSVLWDPENDELRFLPEGPYDLGDGRFSWVAIQHGVGSKIGSLNIFDMHSKTNQTYALPGRPGFAFPTTSDDVFVVGCERTLGCFDIRSGQWTNLAQHIDADRENTIINDAVCMGDVILFGTKDLEFKTKKAGLYLYRGRDQQCIRLRDDQICSNGKAMVPISDDRFDLYDIDTPTKQVVKYELDIETATLSSPTVCLDLRSLPFYPDGMILTPDQSSAIISFYNPDPAEFGETRMYRLTDGAHLATWQTLYSPQATCPQLIRCGDRIRIIITTAVEWMSDANRLRCPHAGKIFIGDTDFHETSNCPKFHV